MTGLGKIRVIPSIPILDCDRIIDSDSRWITFLDDIECEEYHPKQTGDVINRLRERLITAELELGIRR